MHTVILFPVTQQYETIGRALILNYN